MRLTKKYHKALWGRIAEIEHDIDEVEKMEVGIWSGDGSLHKYEIPMRELFELILEHLGMKLEHQRGIKLVKKSGK